MARSGGALRRERQQLGAQSRHAWCMLETTRLTCSPLSRSPNKPATAIVTETSALNHSASFDQRRRPETLRTAMATAFFCPTTENRCFL
jgi:hypothetical protein